MVLLFWDASALAKRYTEEVGNEIANRLFEHKPSLSMASTPWGFAETFSILLRRLNGNRISRFSFESSVSSLQQEIFHNPEFTLFTVSDEQIFLSTAIMRKHNLNSTDAAILSVILATRTSSDAPEIVVVAADKRLLRAAEAEGLRTLNPEEMSLDELSAFISSLKSTI